MASTQPAASVTGTGSNAAATAAVSQAFRAQTQPTIKRPGNVLSAPLSAASTTTLPDTQIPPTTLLRCIYLECSATTSANALGVVYKADAPLNLFSQVNFHDAQGTSIVGSFDSLTLSLAQKYFGFVNNSDPAQSAVYTATAGTGATGGSFTIVYRIPVEVVSRTGVGSQINTDTQSPLVLSLTLNQSTQIYSTAPTTLPTVNVIVSYGGYWNQSGNPNSFATPTAVGSLNYVNWTNYTGLNGQQQFQLNNIGLGNSVMNIMFINRDAGTGTPRSDPDFPNPLQVAYRGNVLGQWSQLLWKHMMSEAYGFGNGQTDAGLGSTITGAYSPTGATSLNAGVYNLWFNADFVFDPGNTLFYGMLNTAVGDSIELTGSWNAASTLYEVINFLAVSGPVSAIQGH